MVMLTPASHRSVALMEINHVVGNTVVVIASHTYIWGNLMQCSAGPQAGSFRDRHIDIRFQLCHTLPMRVKSNVDVFAVLRLEVPVHNSYSEAVRKAA
jgi:hypothetical protein